MASLDLKNKNSASAASNDRFSRNQRQELRENRLEKFLSAFLFIFLFFITVAVYFLDKQYFLCPIEYKRGIIIRRDDFGEGDFGAPRSRNRKHQGIDLYAPINTEIRAVRFSYVKETGFHKNLGNYVELYHPGNLVTIYGHLSKILVKPTRWIPQGEVIGYVGKSGNARHPKILPHLHFEIRRKNVPINPLGWLED